MDGKMERSDPRMMPFCSLPEAARGQMLEIGPIWGRDIQKHRDMVFDAYAPLLAASAKEGVRLSRDVVYGPHAAHRLDVFRPEGRSAAPVVLFVHGGAFVRGSKCVNEEIYGNLLYYFARHGFLGINMEYRLATEAPYPGGAEDVARAVAWIGAHAAELGGDPSRVFLIGHSAGGTHIGTYLFDPAVVAKPGPEVAGAVFISARMRADARLDNPNAAGVRAYFGDDESRYEARSPLMFADRSALPVMIAIAEFENPLLDVYGAEFLWRLAVARGRTPRFVRLTGHNHISIVAHFSTSEDFLGQEILDFIASGG